MNHLGYIKMAARISRMKIDGRTFCLGAVAIRDDDVLIFAYNGHPSHVDQKAHCEARLTRKLDKGATVYLARTLADGSWGNSMPCQICNILLRKRQVKKLYYTSGTGTFDSITFDL